MPTESKTVPLITEWKDAVDRAFVAIEGITDEEVVIRAFCDIYRYQDKIKDSNGIMITNPLRKLEFTKNKILEFVVNTVAEFEVRQAQEVAREEALKRIQERFSV